MKHKKSIILWGIVVALMIGIFYMSSQPATKSNETSYKLIGEIANIINPGYSRMTPIEKKTINSRYNLITRKITHATVYFFLAAFSLAALGLHIRFRKNRVQLALIICMLFAISDELHQRFVPGRSAHLTDVLIDLAGATLAIFIGSITHRTNSYHIK